MNSSIAENTDKPLASAYITHVSNSTPIQPQSSPLPKSQRRAQQSGGRPSTLVPGSFRTHTLLPTHAPARPTTLPLSAPPRRPRHCSRKGQKITLPNDSNHPNSRGATTETRAPRRQHQPTQLGKHSTRKQRTKAQTHTHIHTERTRLRCIKMVTNRKWLQSAARQSRQAPTTLQN